MARSPTRTRKVLLAITLAMLVVVLVAGGVSYWKEACLSGWSTDTPAVALDSNTPQPVSVRVRHTILASMRGSLVVAYNYDELFNVAPDDYARLSRPSAWKCTVLPSVGFPGGSALGTYVRPDPIVNVFGVEWHHASSPVFISFGMAIPHALVAAFLAAAAFGLWFPHRRSARRRAEGLCLRCGYDRRGLAPAASCPECGETPAPAPPAA